MKSLTSVGLAQARPSYLHLPDKRWKVYTKVHTTEVTSENTVSYVRTIVHYLALQTAVVIPCLFLLSTFTS